MCAGMKIRCKYNRCAVIVLLTISFFLSLLSALDCKFMVVDVGFVPQNINRAINSKNQIGIGLWSVEDTSTDGLCVVSAFRKGRESITEDDDIYNTFFISDDFIITVVRFVSLFGLLLAIINLMIVWASLFALFENLRTTKKKVTILFYILLLTFVCEGLKIGFMFMTYPCIGDEFWESIDIEKGPQFHKADQCFIDRGCYMSITSIALDLGVSIHLLMSIIFADYTHSNESDFVYDDVSLPSYLHSLAGSVVSKASSNASRISTSFRNIYQGSSDSHTTSTGSRPNENGGSSPMITSGFYQPARRRSTLGFGRRQSLGTMPAISENGG